MIVNCSSFDYRLTVIVPAYNHERYILECLEGIYNQSFKNFKWVVVDDASHDKTPEILKQYQKKFGYKLFLNKENLGLSETLTRVIKKEAVGEYISICASDDFWCVDKLQKQIDFLDNHPNYAMCYSRTYNVDINSKLLGVCDYSKFRGGSIFDDIITQSFHPPVHYMIRKSVIEKLGYYKKNIIAEDFYMNCLISHRYLIGYIPEALGYYRVSPMESKRDPYLLYKSHEDTIKLFHDEKVYHKAYALHCMRCFSALSMFKKYKLLSFKYLLPSLSQMNVFVLIKSVVHLFFYWR